MSLIEVEIKIKIDRLDNMANQLISLGYQFIDKVIETDTYFTSLHHDFKKLDEALRVRKIQNLTNNSFSQVITYKGKKIDTISMSRTETELEISSSEDMIYILENIGFSKVRPVIKTRLSYKKDSLTACLDEVDGLGCFLEMEILVNDTNNKNAALKIIESELSLLGLSMSNTTRNSYLSMIMNQND